MQDTFHGVIAFALMAGFLVIGSILRNRIPLCRNMLVPSGIIGGGIGLFLLSMGWIPGYQPGDFISLTFHFFTLSFMSLCLTGTSREASRSGGGILRGGMWLTIIWTISLGFQGVLGYLTIRGYNAVTGAGISEWLGAIVTHGFTQGPGQALTYGSIWENEYAVEHVTQIGLVYASLGFLVTFVVGVPLAKRLIRKGLNENKASRLDDNFLTGLYAERVRPEMGRMISHPASLDSLAYHLGLLAIAYLVTHCWLLFMQGVLDGVEPAGIDLGVLFSHNLFFLHGLGVCVLMRLIIDKFGMARLVDDESLKRITGSSVDFMVVGTLMSIQFSVLYALLVPVVLVTAVVTLTTLVMCIGLGRLSGRLGHERALTSFGCCCGSTGTGLLLLRMMDADLSTSVPKELAFFNLAIIITTFHLLFIFAPLAPSLSGWSYLLIFGGTALLFLAIIPLMLIRRPVLGGRKAETKRAVS